jgi:hypothetical protein
VKRLRTLLAASLLLPALVTMAPEAVAATRDCAVGEPSVPGTDVVSVTAVAQPGGEVPTFPGFPPITDVPPYCEITVILTHPGVGDRVNVTVWLPVDGWTGRFQGVGGGGYAMSQGAFAHAEAVKLGYAAASTDGGLGTDIESPAGWALGPDGHVDQELLRNFASRSLHDMTVAGKAVTADHYGRRADYSYWNGCSTGGRQGLMNAQRYPHDYDGINATAPAVNWDRFLLADLWPQVVMRQERNIPTQCELSAFQQAAIAACDGLDQVNDSVVDLPNRCRYNPYRLVGTTILCDGREITISRADAEVVRKIWEGPPAWYGLNRSTPFTGLANTVPGPDGAPVGVPFRVAETWVQYFLKEDPDFDVSTVTYRDFDRLFALSQRKYNRIIGTDDPDLSAFRASGGKMITWHGTDDSLIPYQGTVDYRDRVERTMGGSSTVDRFYRVFLAPGVDHCFGGTGPFPVDPLGALVDWVEKGEAPDTLFAVTPDGSGTRNLCRYPLTARYDGHGDPKAAASYTCRRA